MDFKRIFKYILIIIFAVLIFTSCGTQQVASVILYTPEPAASSAPSPTPSPSASPSAVPAPSPTTAPDPVGELISRMSDKQLIGQMVMIGFDGTRDMDSASLKLLQDYNVGNVFLFGWNTKSFAQTQKLIAKINTHNPSEIPLLFGIDLEGGSVIRFIGQWKPSLSSAQKLGAANDPQRVYDQYKRTGTQLKSIGINIDFAPVLDIAKNPSSTFLGKRMFGSNPAKVSALVREAINGLHDAGVASLGKHFPWLGGTADDPHKTLPVMYYTLDQLKAYSFIPFQAAIDGGADAMMVTHISYPNIDKKYISSVSPTFIAEILRGQMGFAGVVFSDDLRMEGLRSKYTVGEGAVLHILAGGDVVLIGKSADLKKQVLDSLNSAVQQGRITRERLEESVRRILELKIKYDGLVP